MAESFKKLALEYHSNFPCGKLQVLPSKPMATQSDLALAYSPGVAIPCKEIADSPSLASKYTMRGNLVGVISNGTAVLGLGNIGALASKPVMEGKAALFKKFAGIDVFDIEVDETDTEAFCETVARLEPTFGGINLEDIKAPECFEIEANLRSRMTIPVFHDDQHGTAIVSAAAVINSLELVGKSIEDIKIVANGAGAAALACLDLLVSFGAKLDNITVCDRQGVVHSDRTDDMDCYKARYARKTNKRSLTEALNGADVFLGLSAGKVVSAPMVAAMASNPLILAMANPEPEIRPELVKSVRDDAIIATGRSDYPNQVNNVLCFPFIFRGALDVGATEINEQMKQACARAIAEIAKVEASDVVLSAYGSEALRFGPEYIIPKPFDPRLILEIAPAVAQAAMDTGVAERPIKDMEQYRQDLTRFVYQSGMLMKPVMEKAAADPKTLVFAEGESSRVLQAAHQAIANGIATPILIGSKSNIHEKTIELGLALDVENDIQVVDPETVSLEPYAATLHSLVGRNGIAPKEAARGVRNDPSVLAFCMLARGEVDAAICGTNGRFGHHLTRLDGIVGQKSGAVNYSTLNALVLPSGTVFLADTYVNSNPTAEDIAEITIQAAATLKSLGVTPKAALLSNSNFGDRPNKSSKKMKKAASILQQRKVDFEFDGEMNADAALSVALRQNVMPNSNLKGAANLLIMPNADAAHISLNLIKSLAGGVSVGPIMMGAAQPAHIVSQSITVRGLLNMAAIAVVDAQTNI
ncbi:NADP-dependent malic enzyme [Primorskyibacter aestuariivivens]|uniref:NADP-dependent malic enzyme n=1 Tax=Primorskyibacter aestuariivivens TaxID=1888912 RepID=UPI00230069DF|nr:NADP-dependent malic enzyme [Primorskyibacter aestuariivivens]MDA7430605.1 NADP-dependent malic enzyme [Primorskyibacter aestuariivivens]